MEYTHREADIVRAKFHEYFNTDFRYMYDELLFKSHSVYKLDLGAFEKWVVDKHGYDEEKESLNDFVIQKWGVAARDFLKELL